MERVCFVLIAGRVVMFGKVAKRDILWFNCVGVFSILKVILVVQSSQTSAKIKKIVLASFEGETSVN